MKSAEPWVFVDEISSQPCIANGRRQPVNLQRWPGRSALIGLRVGDRQRRRAIFGHALTALAGEMTGAFQTLGGRVGGRDPRHDDSMIYTSTITGVSLRLRESRLIADLLLQGVDDEQWRRKVVEQNLLQMGSEVSIHRKSRALRARIEPMGEGLWRMIRDGARLQATQATFAGAVKHSRLLGDFMDITMREQRTLFAQRLEPRMWIDYIQACRGRDPDMPHWNESTVARLRSGVFSMLAEAGYLENTQSLAIQNVFLDKDLATYLRDRSENYVLRCMKVAS